ncbi:sensor domain-containing diguanylate cyclase [Paraburkholderia acidiphila]|uniref:diguanylate cyclase n=1 Tax=Paraburkholderia acidiphila TaxID=2571747 RepID=A0A7Z2JDI5_9BURK|nr:diguanylate cyclase [Paraburkholderia acidiphila]QGZ59120.1 diguanylate cyclase [Paraburkholderia acidiphila]
MRTLFRRSPPKVGQHLSKPSRSWLGFAQPILVVLVSLNILTNATQDWWSFNNLNQQTAQRLDSAISVLAGRIEDRVKTMDVISLAVSDALNSGRANDATLQSIAARHQPVLGSIAIVVLDPAGKLRAASEPLNGNYVPWLAKIQQQGCASWSSGKTWLAPFGQDYGIMLAQPHLDRARQVDACIVIAVPQRQDILQGATLPMGTAAMLRNADNQVIARFPSLSTLSFGQTYTFKRFERAGPTPGAWYLHSPVDGIDRLGTSRTIDMPRTGEQWILNMSVATNVYRAPWWSSVFFDLAGALIESALLVAGLLLLRRERSLNLQVAESARVVSNLVEHTPSAIALVEYRTGKIRLGNEALKGEFGALAGTGEPIEQLFANPADWAAVRDGDRSEPFAMVARTGLVHMLVRRTHLGESAGDTGDLLLVTLVDVDEQYQQISLLRSEADFDPLTGLPNRRHFERAAAQAVAMAQRHQTQVAVLGLDLDHFKRVNDTWGHAAGDQVLAEVARLFKASLRDQDLPARMGGEEFAAILPGTDGQQARSVAERIRVAVQSTPVVLEDGQVVHITVSIGGALYRSGEADLHEAVKRADAALYRAKQSGRNRVEIDVCDDVTEGPPDGGEDHDSALLQA